MKNFLLVLLGFFAVGFGVGTLVLGILYVNTNKQVTDYKSQVSELNTEVQECAQKSGAEDSLEQNCPLEFTFRESSFGGVEVTYPVSWSGRLETEISEDFVYEPTHGKVISEYKYILTKEASTLTFLRILGATGFLPDGVRSSEANVVEVGTNVLRISQIGDDNWGYYQKLSCSDVDPTLFDLTTMDYCYVPLFPGFGTENGASQVSLQSSDSALISEADEIVLSSI